MDDNARDRLDEAVDDLLERNREAMQQHGELGGTTNNDDLAPDESDDPLHADPAEVEQAIDHMRQRASQRAREAYGDADEIDEIPGE